MATEKEKLEAKLVDLTIRVNRRAPGNIKKIASLQRRINAVKEKLARLNAGLSAEPEPPAPQPKQGGMSIPYDGGMGQPGIVLKDK